MTTTSDSCLFIIMIKNKNSLGKYEWWYLIFWSLKSYTKKYLFSFTMKYFQLHNSFLGTLYALQIQWDF